MAFLDMWREIEGSVPKISPDAAKKFVNRAWTDLRRKNLWSFQLFEGNWLSPQLLTPGTLTATLGLPTVIVDSGSATVFNGIGLTPPLVGRQLRSGVGTIYTIWAWDGVSTLTLDRPWIDPTVGAGIPYTVYQCYYVAPYRDVKKLITVRDMVNFRELYTYRYTREQLDQMDPQRLWYAIPSDVVPFAPNGNLQSTSYGYPQWEVWGPPQNNLTYQLYGLRSGADLAAPTDLLPPVIDEDCVLAKARYYAYEWAEANKGDMPRNAGTDWRFLMGQAEAEYIKTYRECRVKDRENVNNYFSIRRVPSGWVTNNYYNSQIAAASSGWTW